MIFPFLHRFVVRCFFFRGHELISQLMYIMIQCVDPHIQPSDYDRFLGFCIDFLLAFFDGYKDLTILFFADNVVSI